MMANLTNGQLRQQITQQAVKLLAESVEVDYSSAKTKAAKMLGYTGKQDLPSNLEIETELKKYQSIFCAESQAAIVKEKRSEALSAMKFFEQFEPRLVGAVLEGTATKNTPIEIQLFVDSFKEVTLYLIENKIPYEIFDRTIRVNKRESKQVPVIVFSAGDHDIEMSVFLYKDLRQKFLSPVSGLAESRASIKKVQSLV
jgi:hypothetical protein